MPVSPLCLLYTSTYFDRQQFVAVGVGLCRSVGIVLYVIVFVVLFLLEVHGTESAVKLYVEASVQVQRIAEGNSGAGSISLIDAVSPCDVVGHAEKMCIRDRDRHDEQSDAEQPGHLAYDTFCLLYTS